MLVLSDSQLKGLAERVGIEMGAMVVAERAFRRAARLIAEGLSKSAHAQMTEAIEQLKEHRCKLDGILRELEGEKS